MQIKAFRRPDGSLGIRNKVLVMSTVGCANETAARIVARVPGTVLIPNTKGCGQIGGSVAIMKRAMTGLAMNPNVYGVLLVGLGCETIQPHTLYEEIRSKTTKPLAVITIQEEGGTVRTIERGIELTDSMVNELVTVPRVAAGLDEILLATNCGGSDATSGLSANPALGYCSDRLIGAGGSVMLGETTELIGTEHILARRAKDEIVRHRILAIVKGLEAEFVRRGVDIRGANPSPGNMKGGLSTLEEKALGGISKGGSTPVNEVVRYGEAPREKGLIIMDTPGYDIESVTGMAAGGAQLCVFTTGRGTPIGNPVIPVLKVTGNRETYKKMADNIDLDVSGILQGTLTLEECGEMIFTKLLDVCNGELTKAEEHGFAEISVYRNFELWCNQL